MNSTSTTPCFGSDKTVRFVLGGKRSLRQQAKTVGHPSPGTATQQEVEALARQVYRSGEPPSPKMARYLLRQARLDAEG